MKIEPNRNTPSKCFKLSMKSSGSCPNNHPDSLFVMYVKMAFSRGRQGGFLSELIESCNNICRNAVEKFRRNVGST